jgi:hypothetical protein
LDSDVILALQPFEMSLNPDLDIPTFTNDTDTPDIDIGGDEHTRNHYYNLILWLPFVLIPAIILFVRCIKYAYRFYKVRESFLVGASSEIHLGQASR